MATIDRSFADGLFWRLITLGAVLAPILALAVSIRFGYSVALGALVSALSLRVTVIAVYRMMTGVNDGTGTYKRRTAFWGAVLAFKLAGLLFVIFVVLVYLDAHAVAFVLGFKLILPALAWQAIRNSGEYDEPVDNADDTESP